MEKDPIYRSGRYPVPHGVLRHLQAVDGAGARFDALYIAHELPKGLIEKGDDVAVWRAIAPPPPRDIVRLSSSLGRVSLGTLLGAFGIAPLRAAAKTGLAIGAAIAAMPLMALDPVIFGAIAARQPARTGDPAFFFLLASWKWE